MMYSVFNLFQTLEPEKRDKEFRFLKLHRDAIIFRTAAVYISLVSHAIPTVVKKK
jgi:hypothetical protein